jgi:RimJ/RimL family protein N-acetyltransferase
LTADGTGHPVRLVTERLILDGHRPEDFEPLAAMWSDPVIMQGLGGQLSTRQESWMRLLRYRGLWPVLGYGYWAVREKTTGRFVGDIGFADFHREIDPSIDGVPEAGWILAAWAHGRCFAAEAATAAFGWLDGKTGFARSVCLIDPANRASIRLAERCGFRSPVTVAFRGAASLLFTRERP